MAFSYDNPAVEVLALAQGNGAVKFEGWLGPLGDKVPKDEVAPDTGETSAATFRLFTDPQFLEWLEIPRTALLSQLPAAHRDGRSIVWVARGAQIKRCQTGTAYWFSQLDDDTALDPTTARWPRPPY